MKESKGENVLSNAKKAAKAIADLEKLLEVNGETGLEAKGV